MKRTAIIGILALLVACNPYDNSDAGKKTLEPSVTIGVGQISAVSAVLRGKANPDASAQGNMYLGFEYSKTEDLAAAVAVPADDADADNNFSAVVSLLDPATRYYYRSVLKQGDKEYFGETKEFTSKELSSLLETAPASGIEQKAAVLNASLNLTGVHFSSFSFGFLWGQKDAYEGQEIKAEVIAEKAFSAGLDKLSCGTEYWYKAFLTLDGHSFFGDVVSFTTEPFSMQAVDLGLSVKWASCNLGAEDEDGYGDYYAWGEVETYYESLDPITWKEGKQYGDWLSYRWFKEENDNSWITKYVDDASYGTVDNKSVLDPEDDAAAVLLGDGWRMPTHEEWNELISSCTWTWTNVNEVEGYKVEGNGNSIFLPASGCMDFKIRFREDEGYYWSSSLFETEIAFAVNFWNDEDPPGTDFAADRTTGLTIRPVKP